MRQAMLLAAGRGSRLGRYTAETPKVMVPVGGRPLIEHTVEHLACQGIRDLVINLCYRPEVVRLHLGDGRRWGVTIRYSLEAEPLGTAGGLRHARHLWGEGPLLVWYGDNLSYCDVRQMCRLHRSRGALLTLALHFRQDPTASGIVATAPDGRIERFLEKPGPGEVFSHWVSAGIMVLEQRVLDAIPEQGAADLGRDVLPALIARGERLYGYRLSPEEGLWWVDTPADLERVQSTWRARRTA